MLFVLSLPCNQEKQCSHLQKTQQVCNQWIEVNRIVSPISMSQTLMVRQKLQILQRPTTFFAKMHCRFDWEGAISNNSKMSTQSTLLSLQKMGQGPLVRQKANRLRTLFKERRGAGSWGVRGDMALQILQLQKREQSKEIDKLLVVAPPDF